MTHLRAIAMIFVQKNRSYNPCDFPGRSDALIMDSIKLADGEAPWPAM